jgi:hypothetical protein
MAVKSVNWNHIWERLRRTYVTAGLPRQAAVLDNHRESKEAICRRLGVICDVDINRVSESIRSRDGGTQG